MATNANLYGSGQTSDDMQRTALMDREKSVEDRPKVDLLAKRYWREIQRYEKSTSEWYEEGDSIERVYMDESLSASSSDERSRRRFALLWANIDTLKPAVYTKTPTVLCSRRYRDRDPVGRTAAELMERATNTTFELYGVDEVFRMVRDDRLLSGRGTAWVRYEARIERYDETVIEIDAETGKEVERTVQREKLASEKACVDYVFWKDFGHNVARTWSDVWLAWRCVYKMQDEVADRFGADVAASLSYSAKAPATHDGISAETTNGDNFVKIYEVWDKRNNLTSWLVEGHDGFLESDTPPVDFANFFPCPEPVYSTKTSKSLIPKPDYCYYRDQAKEINDLTEKIHRLTEWLIVKGFIPGGPSSVADPLEEAIRDKSNRELFVTVDSMTEWTEKGGAGKLIDWLPLQHVVSALQSAIQARNQLIQDVFQITGIADILRGQTDPGETLGAQELKAQTGSRRVRNTKDDLARFCRDIARLTSEVIAENFSPKSIAEITGYTYQPPADPFMQGLLPNMTNVAMFPGASPPVMGGAAPAMMANQLSGMAAGLGHNNGPAMSEPQTDDAHLSFDDSVIDLLRNDRMRGFRVDVETDSTIQADENAERQSRTELASVAGQYLERAAKIVQTAPALTRTAGELLMYVVRGYRAGRTMEEIIEQDFAALVKQSEEARKQPPPVDPIIKVAETEVQGKIEADRIKAQLKNKELDQEAKLTTREQNMDAALELRKMNLQSGDKSKDIAARMSQRLAGLPRMLNQ